MPKHFFVDIGSSEHHGQFGVPVCVFCKQIGCSQAKEIRHKLVLQLQVAVRANQLAALDFVLQ